ncbi:lipolytic protein G-D-S-L family [Catenulispora acidiphila DSM 44928]|uniref:Lipolytic protein G-D-S-L family n=1 Tax=Catenulispora acidiphila (strain DSM 44928 / JCM 14897 / NBRC 102108 / NRRL B-24433 / ID139908) TaxID=479433 RepID=C7Q875_CATAD|nr:SGNH/GDSL hydrolase family protein [Catenulispora acidiphila]ACU76063.1 lipolytic protein G-D-S-L family [Catenulispora acidiphila DSM 44928]
MFKTHLSRGLLSVAAAVTAVVTLLGANASATAADHYVALGDSYSSGVGAGSYISSSGSCDRSTNAYSQLWANSRHPASYVSVACSGATTQDVLNNQISALSSSTTLVSITIGGNDVGFSSVMETCVLDSSSTCLNAINAAVAQAKTILPGRLATTFAAIRSAAPSAHVVVLGYPELYDLGHSWYCPGLSGTDRTALNNAADLLDTQIAAAAANAGDTFADVRSRFHGHELCDFFNEWLHSVDVTDVGDSYHPTASGQSGGYYAAFSAVAP